MHTRKNNKDQILTIQPVALNMFQFFSSNEIYTYSLLNTTTAKTTKDLIRRDSIKTSIALKEKSLSSLKNDAKKIQSYITGINDPVLKAEMERKLRQIEEGKVTKEDLRDLMNTEWTCRTRTQDLCESFGEGAQSIGESFYKDHLKDKDDVTREEIYVLLFFYGISGISYAAHYTLGFINNYFAKPLKEQFRARLRFLSQHIEEKKEETEEVVPQSPRI
jgi:hypothetical protein